MRAKIVIPILIAVAGMWIYLAVYATSRDEDETPSWAMTPSETSATTTVQTTSSTEATSSTTAGTSSDVPTGGVNADNEWALFLINQTHPLAEGYTVNTKAVQGDYVMDERAADYMLNMLLAANNDGIDLVVTSAYRSVSYQQTVFDRNVNKLVGQGMTEAEAKIQTAKEIAIPGQSEHNSGLAADIINAGWFNTHTELTDDFENTPEFEWLKANSYKYGFILRYPKGKEDITGIIYEPWHYRFVGVYHATQITQQGVCLEEYLDEGDTPAGSNVAD